MRIHFFHPDIVDHLDEPSFKPENGLDHWISTTYFRLNKHFNTITIGNKIPERGIIFFHKRYFPSGIKPSDLQLFICLQVDSGRHRYAQYHIVHNPYQAKPYYFPKIFVDYLFGFSKTKYICGWAQYKLIKRDKSREKTFKTISFHGNINNIPEEILSDDFLLFLKNKNLEFKIKSESNVWADFHESDLSLCIRKFDNNKYYSKPYLKITNSLTAGVPVVSGLESSSLYFKKKYVNIPVVKNISELKILILNIIEKKYNPFEQIIHFQEHFNFFQDEFVEKEWVSLICKAKSDYSKWLKVSKIKRKLFYLYRSIR